MKKVIIWKAGTRELPTIGLAEEGAELSMDEALADSYIAQGLAEARDTARTATKTSTKKEDK